MKNLESMLKRRKRRLKRASVHYSEERAIFIKMNAGKRPPKRKEDIPKPTEKMQRREGSLEIDKNLNKIMVVSNAGGRGPGAPGFYCEICNRTHKDSVGYLDHLNSRGRK